MRPVVLIADADELLAAAYRAFLVADGFEVHWVTSGLACLETIREHLPDALILDAELPWGSGAGVWEVLTRDPGMSVPPAVLLTASPAAVGAIEPGSFTPATLIKPVSPLLISRTLRELLESRPTEKAESHAHEIAARLQAHAVFKEGK